MRLFGFGKGKRRKSGSSSRIFEDLTGLDQQWLQQPLFMELIKCAVILSDTKADVARLGSADYLRENGLSDFSLHGPGAQSVLRGFGVDEDRLGDPGYMNDAIIRMSDMVDRAKRMNDRQALQTVTAGLRMACIVFAQYILQQHPDYRAPLEDYLGAVGPALHPERDAENQDGLREALLRALACTVGLSWYPMDRLASDGYRDHLEKATSGLAEALVVGGYFKRDATMGELVGDIERVMSGATLDLMLLAPLAFTMSAYAQSEDSVRLKELTDDAYRHQVEAYRLLGGDLSRLEDDLMGMVDQFRLLARQLDAARTHT